MRIKKMEFGILAIVVMAVIFGEWFAETIARRPILIIVLIGIVYALAHYYQGRKRRR